MGLINFGRDSRTSAGNDFLIPDKNVKNFGSSVTSPSSVRRSTNKPPQKYWLTGALSTDGFPSILRSISVSDIGYNYDSRSDSSPTISFKYSWKYSRTENGKKYKTIISGENKSHLPWWKMNTPIRVGDNIICEISLLVDNKVKDTKEYDLGVVNARPMSIDHLFLTNSANSYEPLTYVPENNQYYIKTNAYGHESIRFRILAKVNGTTTYITKSFSESKCDTNNCNPEDYYITSMKFMLPQTIGPVTEVSVEADLYDGNKYSKRIRETSGDKEVLFEGLQLHNNVIYGQEPFEVKGIYPLYHTKIKAAKQSKLYAYHMHDFDYTSYYSPADSVENNDADPTSGFSLAYKFVKEVVDLNDSEQQTSQKEIDEYLGIVVDPNKGRSCILGYILYNSEDPQIYYKESYCLDNSSPTEISQKSSELYEKLLGYIKTGSITNKGPINVPDGHIPYVHVENYFAAGEECENWDCEKKTKRTYSNQTAQNLFYSDIDLEDVASEEACDLPVCNRKSGECSIFAPCCRTSLKRERERYIWDLFYCRRDYNETGNDSEYLRCVEDAKWDFCISSRIKCFGETPGQAAVNCQSQGFKIPSVTSTVQPGQDENLRVPGVIPESELEVSDSSLDFDPLYEPPYGGACGSPVLVPYATCPDSDEPQEWLDCDPDYRKRIGNQINRLKQSCYSTYVSSVNLCLYNYNTAVSVCNLTIPAGPIRTACRNAALNAKNTCVTAARTAYANCMNSADCLFCRLGRSYCFLESCQRAVSMCQDLGYKSCPNCPVVPASPTSNIFNNPDPSLLREPDPDTLPDDIISNDVASKCWIRWTGYPYDNPYWQLEDGWWWFYDCCRGLWVRDRRENERYHYPPYGCGDAYPCGGGEGCVSPGGCINSPNPPPEEFENCEEVPSLKALRDENLSRCNMNAERGIEGCRWVRDQGLKSCERYIRPPSGGGIIDPGAMEDYLEQLYACRERVKNDYNECTTKVCLRRSDCVHKAECQYCRSVRETCFGEDCCTARNNCYRIGNRYCGENDTACEGVVCETPVVPELIIPDFPGGGGGLGTGP